MKITIDTKEDSPEDIKGVIQLLQQKIGTNVSLGKEKYQDFFEAAPPKAEQPAFTALFGPPDIPKTDVLEIKEAKEAPKEELDEEKVLKDLLDQVEIYDD